MDDLRVDRNGTLAVGQLERDGHYRADGKLPVRANEHARAADVRGFSRDGPWHPRELDLQRGRIAGCRKWTLHGASLRLLPSYRRLTVGFKETSGGPAGPAGLSGVGDLHSDQTCASHHCGPLLQVRVRPCWVTLGTGGPDAS